MYNSKNEGTCGAYVQPPARLWYEIAGHHARICRLPVASYLPLRLSDVKSANTISSSMKQHAIHVIRELRRHGFEAYFAGGCVRDLLLGLEPADYDVTTNATPNEVMRIFPETYAVGAQFGVVLVPIPKDSEREIVPPKHLHAIEVATFRSDGIYSDGRHPDKVQYSKSPEEDVQRRDFTINGLLMDPLDGDRVLD